MRLTSEYFESAGITVFQPAVGHRYGGESLALAEFVDVRPGESVVEFGSGVGVVALLIAAKLMASEMVAVEIQSDLHRIGLRNVERNGFSGRLRCVNDDYRNFAIANSSSFDLVISNPPFYAAGSGRVGGNPQRAIARHEIHGGVSDILMCAKKVLKPSGRAALVFALDRKEDLLRVAARAGFWMARYRDGVEVCGGGAFLAEFTAAFD